MTGQRPVTAVVLAGGRSSRFGDDMKATATLGGTALVERVVEAVRTATGRNPVVAAGPPEKRAVIDDVLSQPVRYASDAEWCSGPVAGVCGALSETSTPTLFLCGCDMPLLSSRAVSWLLDRHADSDADGTVPLDETGAPQLLHGVYETAALADACNRHPDRHSLRSLVAALSTDTVSLAATPDDIPLSQSAMNVNTRSDLADARLCVSPDEYVRR
ncbi:molybdenum cofactor guanylyltransferase (plasmid) [Haloferax sp. S1W]|uniref:molybdenum cofactor guanylyltransferase n=1 Tax=Haloferax sp. S1W TaxID=3377110 RepID=UPI0037C6206B